MGLLEWVEDGAALEGTPASGQRWSKGDLLRRVEACREGLVSNLGEGARVGLIAENSPLWIAIDLAAHAASVHLVPLPGFFTMEQLLHAVRAARLDAMFCFARGFAASLGFTDERFDAGGLRLFAVPDADARASRRTRDGAHKITFTSGTTGNPKGVLLSMAQQQHAAQGLAQLVGKIGIHRHLCALPFAVLLENVGGAYTALRLGATCVCPPVGEVGLSGSSDFDPERCLEAIARFRPDSMILLPQMLRLLVARLDRARPHEPRIRSLKYVTVGGAKTPAGLIERARALGLPVYEGYGLTECASVVSVNVPGADRLGTVGRPLPGVEVRVTSGGELEIGGRGFCGYLDSEPCDPDAWVASGDLGTVDGDGFVSIVGRRTNVIVTGYGRNVSPEWPESLLLESPALAQAAVYGESSPHLTAVLVAASRHIPDAALRSAVARANASLPDYARIGRWIRAHEPFTAQNGLATGNGRVRRDAIEARYDAEPELLQRGAE
jgi:long-subunit acyl-CoA synthetase (AMP-forming)